MRVKCENQLANLLSALLSVGLQDLASLLLTISVRANVSRLTRLPWVTRSVRYPEQGRFTLFSLVSPLFDDPEVNRRAPASTSRARQFDTSSLRAVKVRLTLMSHKRVLTCACRLLGLRHT